jgi:hypothetical protein
MTTATASGDADGERENASNHDQRSDGYSPSPVRAPRPAESTDDAADGEYVKYRPSERTGTEQRRPLLGPVLEPRGTEKETQNSDEHGENAPDDSRHILPFSSPKLSVSFSAIDSGPATDEGRRHHRTYPGLIGFGPRWDDRSRLNE